MRSKKDLRKDKEMGEGREKQGQGDKDWIGKSKN